MILAELNKMLLNVARSNYLVNDAFIGDVYTINGKENRFGCFVATPMSAVKESGTITYNYYLYYIDRLTKDEMNIDYVQSDAVSMLKGLLDFIEQNGVEVETGSEFTLFRQQFSDWCAGAYVNVNILVADNDCVGGDFNISGYDLTSLNVDRNGIYEPGQGYDGFNKVTINVPQVGATEEWVDDEIDLKLTGYATEEWVLDKHYLTEHQDISGKADKGYVDAAISSAINSLDLEDFATMNWVSAQGFLKSANLAGFATENWVVSQGFIKTDALDGLASQTWVNSQGFIKTDALENYATKTWVENQDYLKDEDLDGYATEDFVIRQGYLVGSALNGYATESWVRNQNFLVGSDLNGYATEDFIRQQEFITISELCDYATKEWVLAQDFLTQDDLCGLATEQWVINWVTAQDYLQECDLDGYATENWVLNQGFATEDWVDQNYASKSWVEYNFVRNSVLNNYATKTWVENNFVDQETLTDYVTSTELLAYATKEWVENQHYLTEHQDISGKLDRDDVWSGTEDDWDELTDDEKCSYLIALIVE